jgi:hypothetical protein
MPYADPAQQQAYYKERQERRKVDSAYKAQRNQRQRARYQDDPEYQERVRTYQSSYRKRRRQTDPEYAARVRLESLESGRHARGLRWTDEQRNAFNTMTQCEICNRRAKLHADHCHDCGAYRGALCGSCNTSEGYLRKWSAVCPEGTPMRLYMDRHVCDGYWPPHVPEASSAPSAYPSWETPQ